MSYLRTAFAVVLLASGSTMFAQSSEVSIQTPPPPKYVGRLLKPFHLERRGVAFGWKLRTIGQTWSSRRQAGPRRRQFGDGSFFPGAEPAFRAIALPQRVFTFYWENTGAFAGLSSSRQLRR